MLVSTLPYQRRPSTTQSGKVNRVELRFRASGESRMWVVEEAALRSLAERRHVEQSEVIRDCFYRGMRDVCLEHRKRDSPRQMVHVLDGGRIRPMTWTELDRLVGWRREIVSHRVV